MDKHANGGRVLVPGSASFWLNVYTQTPQVRGCCDQNELFKSPGDAYCQVFADNGAGAAETSLVWLRALGVRYIALCGPRSTEQYGDTKFPHKFDGLLPLMWSEGDDSIMQVPVQSASLAHVVARSELIARSPASGVDVAPLRPFVAAIQDPWRPEAQFEWDLREGGTIRASVPRGRVFSVQIPYHFGWRATVADRNISVERDGLGMMVLAPDCDGLCRIKLTFDGGTEATIAGVASGLAWIAAFGAITSRLRLRTPLRYRPFRLRSR